jgi:hypothetical protein
MNYKEIIKTQSLYDHFAERFAEMQGGRPDDYSGAGWDAVAYISEMEEGNRAVAEKHLKDLESAVPGAYEYLLEVGAPKF